MRAWKRTSEEIPTLVEAFFINDPYYPRPDPNDSLYVQFKAGYLSVYPENAIDLGEAFLHAIEAEQCRRYDISSTG
jgi:Zinc finger protein